MCFTKYMFYRIYVLPNICFTKYNFYSIYVLPNICFIKYIFYWMYLLLIICFDNYMFYQTYSESKTIRSYFFFIYLNKENMYCMFKIFHILLMFSFFSVLSIIITYLLLHNTYEWKKVGNSDERWSNTPFDKTFA